MFVERVGKAKEFAPYDLTQALLRLAPTMPGDAARFDRLRMTARAAKGVRRFVGRPVSGVEMIRAWIVAGGAHGDGSSGRILPIPDGLAGLDSIDTICGRTADEHRIHLLDMVGWLGVTPHDLETVMQAAPTADGMESTISAGRLPIVVRSSGPFGPATYRFLANLLASGRAESRLIAAEHVAFLGRHERLDPSLLRTASLGLFEHGSLSLARAAHGWDQVAIAGSLSMIWPTWRAVLAAACGQAKKPTGLAELIRAARAHVGVAATHDTEAVPESLRALAEAKGSSKAAAEARAYVAEVTA